MNEKIEYVDLDKPDDKGVIMIKLSTIIKKDIIFYICMCVVLTTNVIAYKNEQHTAVLIAFLVMVLLSTLQMFALRLRREVMENSIEKK